MFAYLTSHEEVYKFMHHQVFHFFCALGSMFIFYTISPMVFVEFHIGGGGGGVGLWYGLGQSLPYEPVFTVELGSRSIFYQLQV